jgi:hypothetical protein
MTSPDQERLSAELLSCPFCGGPAEIWPRDGMYQPRCKRCSTDLRPYRSLTDAITAWNRRAPAPTPEAGGAAGWIITYSDGSAAFAFTDEEAEEAIAEASPGATKAPVFFASRPTPADERGDGVVVGTSCPPSRVSDAGSDKPTGGL